MMQGDIRARLSDAVSDAHRGTSHWGYYIDHAGDETSGDVVYSCDGDVRMCPYEIATVNGKVAVNLAMTDSKNVVPVTSYQEEVEDDDHYTAMEEAGLYTKGPVPLCERFISKKERDAASEEDFAGKGKSFPILQPGDVQAAVHAMGRAGAKNVGTSTLKSRIIAIAKKKGWSSYLPKAWRGEDTKASESGVSRETGAVVRLTESVAFLEDIPIKEAFKSSYQIKLIAPGKGSSAWYTEEVLKRDGPKVFKAGTPMRIDHPTEAQEAERPEGSVKDWGAVLAKDAYWLESHRNGPGLYSEIKPFSDHVQTIDEKGPYAGVSISANGHAVMEAGKQVMRDGVPVLASFTSAEGVDMVTRAGAGGMFLSESARGAQSQQEGQDVDLKEVQRLINEGIATANAPLLERAIRGDAREEAGRILAGVTLPDAAKAKITESALKQIPKKDGNLDVDAFRLVVVAEAKAEGEYLASILGPGQVRGMGASFAAPVDPEKLREAAKREKEALLDLEEAENSVFSELTGLQLVKGKVA